MLITTSVQEHPPGCFCISLIPSGRLRRPPSLPTLSCCRIPCEVDAIGVVRRARGALAAPSCFMKT
eukprot:7748079-Pyramimonas_sp.AAC.1